MTTSTASGRNIKSKEYAQPYMPAATYTPWQRPTDWLTLPSLSSTVVFTGLFAVFDDSNNYVAIQGIATTGIYTVDWGDGTSITSSGTTLVTHNYAYSSISSSTLTSRGYRQAIITITMNSGTFTGIVTGGSDTSYANIFASRGWLDMKMGDPTLSSINISNTQSNSNLLENVTIESCAATVTSLALSNLSGLQNITLPVTTKLSSAANLFSGCTALIAAPMFDTSTNTAFNSMFAGCSSLKYVPNYITSNCTTFASMFSGCSIIESIPQFDTSKATNTSFMFQSCFKLGQIPYLNTSNVTTMSGMFSACYNLSTAPPLDTTKVTTTSSMFLNCNSLESVPLYNTSNVTTADSMFFGCTSLPTISAFDTSKFINASTMFSGCQSLLTIPTLSLANVTNAAGMFNGCSSLQDASMLSFPALTTGYGTMFASCAGLVNLPATMGSNSINTGNFTSSFSGCTKLENDITLYTGTSTGITSAFQNCTNLSNVTIIGNNFTSMASIFSGAKSIRNVVFSNCSAVTTGATSTFSPPTSLTKLRVPNLKVSLTVSQTALDKDNMEIVFNDLLGNATAQTVTISNTLAAAGVLSSTAPTGQAAGTIILTVTSSSGFVIGQPVYSTTLFPSAAVTMQDAGDTVTRTGHGLANGTRVSFATIVSTTGISINTIYYVVNATVNTFQVSLTNGGAALPLTTNGTGTLRFEVFLIDIPSSTQLTLSSPTTGASNGTGISTRPLNTYLASLKNWTISG